MLLLCILIKLIIINRLYIYLVTSYYLFVGRDKLLLNMVLKDIFKMEGSNPVPVIMEA